MSAVALPRRDADPLPAAHGEMAAQRASVRVAVLLDAASWCGTGSRVASWLRVAEAATDLQGLDLTLHVLGDPGVANGVTNIVADNVRTHVHRAPLGNWCLPFLHGMPEHPDVGWVHPAMLAQLAGCDVIHTTDTGPAAARTAALARALWRMALVTSLHAPLRAEPDGAAPRAASWLTRRAQGGPRLSDRQHHKRRAHARRCDWVLSEHDHDALAPVLGHARCAPLRRGLDRARFNPQARDRVRLRRQLGIPVTAPVLCFAGPLSARSRPDLLARAVRELCEAGNPAHVIFAGAGEHYADLVGEVADRGHFPGDVDQDTLAWLMASSDLFVYPAHDAAVPEVVLEAMGCGVPVLAAPGGAERVIRHGVDGLVVHASGPEAWAHAIASLLDDASPRLLMGRAARAAVQRHVPSWREVLEEDLLPVWRAASQRAAARANLV